jgi:hypothetical protein
VLQGLRELLHSMPPPHQNTVYSAIHASDGDFAHLVRSLAASALQSAFRGHRARASVRTLRVCQPLIKDAAQMLKSLPDAVLKHFRQILTGENDHEPGAGDSATESSMTPEEQMLEHIVKNGARILKSTPQHIREHLHATLLHDPDSSGSFCQTLVLNRCGPIAMVPSMVLLRSSRRRMRRNLQIMSLAQSLQQLTRVCLL